MSYVASLTCVLADHLGWHRARLKFIARFVCALLHQRTTNLWSLALALKAGVRPASNHRRIQRFGRRHIAMAGYDVDFVALGRLLLRLVPARPPYVVTIDRTEWNFGDTPVNVLVAAVACKGTAVLIARVALFLIVPLLLAKPASGPPPRKSRGDTTTR